MAVCLSVCHSQQLTQSILDGDSFVSRSATRNFSYCSEDILGCSTWHVAGRKVRRSLQLQLLLATVHGCPMLKVYALSLALRLERRERDRQTQREGVRDIA